MVRHKRKLPPLNFQNRGVGEGWESRLTGHLWESNEGTIKTVNHFWLAEPRLYEIHRQKHVHIVNSKSSNKYPLFLKLAEESGRDTNYAVFAHNKQRTGSGTCSLPETQPLGNFLKSLSCPYK